MGKKALWRGLTHQAGSIGKNGKAITGLYMDK